jgi:uncharacterized protein YndB with AHSA1/START domain/DNA-binding transcriptional ArsR family regulator
MADDELLSAVLEPRRRAILRLLAAEPLPVGRLAERFDVTRPAISQHLAVLRAAGLVEARTESGRSVHHVRSDGVAAATHALSALAAELPGGETLPGAAPAPDLAVALVAPAPPERLFELVTTPSGLARWLGRATVDLRPGGRYRIDLGGDAAAGTYRVVEPPRRVVFGWGQEGGPLAPDSSTVEIRLAPAPAGTHVALEQRGLPAEARAPHLGSWATHLPRLVLAAGD